MIYRGETDRMEIALDTDEKVVWITQKWKCNFWDINRKNKKWTEVEKTHFKRRIRALIQDIWSDKAYVAVYSQSGTKFNVTYGGTIFPVKINIEFVGGGEHWTINIGKVDDINQDQSFICWERREAYISNFSLRKCHYDELVGMDNPGASFWSAAHEFGHMLGNSSALSPDMGDEYPTAHRFHGDLCSIMNNGSEIRRRHFRHIKDLLQTMIPRTCFTIGQG